MSDLLRRARRLDTCIFPNERSKCLCGELADRIEQLEALVEQLQNDNSSMIDDYDTDFLRQEKRIEKLEAALNDMAQYVSQEDWDCFLKPETRKALEVKDES
jgi:hypothetical protein